MRKQKLSEQDILAVFKNRHGNKYRYLPFPDTFTVKSSVAVICPVHGKFYQTIESHMAGSGCRKCAHEKINEHNRLGRAEWIRRFESVHDRGTYDYSKVPEDLRQNAKIEIFCYEHSITFYQTPIQHWRLRQGCPQCGIRKQWDTRKQRLTARRDFVLKAQAVHGGLFEYAELPLEFSLDDMILIYCNEHRHIFFCIAQEHLNGKGCGIS
jgi:predicted  nucleic acid-binding Zn-ribbon protein